VGRSGGRGWSYIIAVAWFGSRGMGPQWRPWMVLRHCSCRRVLLMSRGHAGSPRGWTASSNFLMFARIVIQTPSLLGQSFELLHMTLSCGAMLEACNISSVGDRHLVMGVVSPVCEYLVCALAKVSRRSGLCSEFSVCVRVL